MKRRHAISMRIFIFVAASVSICLAQTKVIDKHGATMFEGRPFITDSALYNSYDLGGSPLGLFDKGSPRFDARFDYRYGELGDGAGKGQYWNAPVLTMGNPGMSFFRIFYGPRILSAKSANGEASLPLHRVGLVGATQGASGALRAAVSIVGFGGYQEWEDDNRERMIAGLEKLRFDLGSQLHPLVRLGLFIDADVRYEEIADPHQDRSCQTNLPMFGVNVDVGGEDLLVRGNVDFSYAWSRFVYTVADNDDRPAIRNDSLSLFLTTQGRLSPMSDDKIVLKPGVLVGFTKNSGKQHSAEAGNNYPINIGSDIKNSQYDLTGFWFGAGTGFGALDYVDAHVEYTLAALWLDCGSFYSAPPVKSRTFHHTAFGVSTNVNKYVEMPIVITPRVAYFILGMAGTVGVPQTHLSLDPLNAAFISKLSLYDPRNFLNGKFAHLSGFTVGVDGQVLEGQAEASVWATFLSNSLSEKKGGMEFGARIGFLLR